MTQAWHDLRAQHVGGSEVAALFGESPYMSKFQLWNIKAGLIDAPDLDQDDRVVAGQMLEGGIIRWANKKWNAKFDPAGVYVKHPSVTGMGCTPDAFWDNDGRRILGQVKLVDGLEFQRKWMFDRDRITEAPLHIILQVQHELDCTDLDEAWLVVCVGGNRLYLMVIQRDAELCAILRRAVGEFWQSVTNKVAPDPDFAKDGFTIRELLRKLPVVPEIDLSDDYVYHLFKRRLAVQKVAKTAGDNLERVTAEIDFLMGGAAIARCRDLTVKRQKNGALRMESLEPINFKQKRTTRNDKQRTYDIRAPRA